jgi:hypothetical protein
MKELSVAAIEILLILAGKSIILYFKIKIFNLPPNIKQLSQETNKIKLALKKFLLPGSFNAYNAYFE